MLFLRSGYPPIIFVDLRCRLLRAHRMIAAPRQTETGEFAARNSRGAAVSGATVRRRTKKGNSASARCAPRQRSKRIVDRFSWQLSCEFGP